jgi:hypothetical protein
MALIRVARWLAPALAAGAVWAGLTAPAHAVPVFARQTGHNCQACHISYPELTAYGREFKLNGYTFGTAQPIPLAFAVMAGSTSVSRNGMTVPDGVTVGGTTVDEVCDPCNKMQIGQASLFSGGRISDNLGAFIQWTWVGVAAGADGGGTHSGMDNTELRWVGRYTPEGAGEPELVYGLNINNNLTMQDVWNAVPAWRYPYWGVGTTNLRTGPPGPAAAPFIDGGTVAQRAIGVGGYAWWKKTWYAELSLLRAAEGTLGFLRAGDSPDVAGDALKGWGNPYWRIAYSHDWDYNSIEVGAFGIQAQQHFVDPSSGLPSASTNKFKDWAIDAQYQYNKGEPHVFTAAGSYIHETAEYNAALGTSNPSDTVKELNLRGTYYYDRKYGVSLGYTRLTGSADLNLYAPPVAGDATGTLVPAAGFSTDGSPDSDFWTLELNWLPLQDLRFTVQYIWYNKLNGYKTDYYGNRASDANTLFAGIWFDF